MLIYQRVSGLKFIYIIPILHPINADIPYIIPSGNDQQFSIEHGHRKFVSFPMNSMVDLSIVFCGQFTRGYHG